MEGCLEGLKHKAHNLLRVEGPQYTYITLSKWVSVQLVSIKGYLSTYLSKWVSVQLENISAMDRVEKACQWLCYNYHKRKV